MNSSHDGTKDQLFLSGRRSCHFPRDRCQHGALLHRVRRVPPQRRRHRRPLQHHGRSTQSGLDQADHFCQLPRPFTTLGISNKDTGQHLFLKRL